MTENWSIRKVLFVCLGNICRSPMAEGLFKQMAIENNLSLDISSAGITACIGRKVEPFAFEIMKARSINIGDHQPTQITSELMRKADLILVMEAWQQKKLKVDFMSAYGKVHRLGKWDNFDIIDPYQRDKQDFKRACELIEEGLQAWQRRLWSKNVV